MIANQNYKQLEIIKKTDLYLQKKKQNTSCTTQFFVH